MASPGISMIGADVALTVGTVTLVGVVSKDFSRAASLIETTDDQAAGWREYSAKPGLRSIDLGVTGILKNLELVKTWYGASLIAACIATWPDGSTETFDAALENFDTASPATEASTFTCGLKSSGASVFVAGT